MQALPRSGLKNSIQTRLGAVMALMLAVILGINMILFFQINTIVRHIDSVFASNVSIQELTQTLELVQENVFEYLNTKSSEALENYYRHEQDYRQLTGQLNRQDVDNASLEMEKNIRNMSETYLKKTEETVQAKRGRNVEHYKASFEEANQLYEYINYYIYQLNQKRFEENSEKYQFLLAVMGVLESMSLLVMLAVFGIGLLAAVTVVRAMIRPLSQLSDAAHRVAEGDFDVELPESQREDEIGVVTKAFDQMLGSIRSYIIRLRTSMEQEAKLKEQELSMEANLKEAQLKFLQAQINPHFLYNSLNAGAQLAVMEDADATGSFLEKMAEFFRYNVRTGDGSSTLGEEVHLVDNYIYILNVRFAGDITYEKEIEPGYESIRIPGMILQPLVENAVTHGIRDNMESGRILLRITREDDVLEVTVRDNGRGMTREEITAILMKGKAEERTIEDPRPVEQSSGDGTGVGLGNVIHRLALYYNQGNLLNIYSEGPGRGTEVTVYLPVIQQLEVLSESQE